MDEWHSLIQIIIEEVAGQAADPGSISLERSLPLHLNNQAVICSR